MCDPRPLLGFFMLKLDPKSWSIHIWLRNEDRLKIILHNSHADYNYGAPQRSGIRNADNSLSWWWGLEVTDLSRRLVWLSCESIVETFVDGCILCSSTSHSWMQITENIPYRSLRVHTWWRLSQHSLWLREVGSNYDVYVKCLVFILENILQPWDITNKSYM